MTGKRFTLQTDMDRMNCLRFLARLPERTDRKRPWVVTVEEAKRRKSNDQCAKIHAMYRDLGLEIGYTEEEIKTWFKETVYGKREITIGSETQWTPKSTADLSMEEASHVIEQIYRIAAETGVVLA